MYTLTDLFPILVFCWKRDGHTLYALCYDKNLFFDIGGDIVEGDSHKRLGISSPWPWDEDEAKVIVEGDTVGYILYWRTGSSIDLERQELLYIQTDNGIPIRSIAAPSFLSLLRK